MSITHLPTDLTIMSEASPSPPRIQNAVLFKLIRSHWPKLKHVQNQSHSRNQPPLPKFHPHHRPDPPASSPPPLLGSVPFGTGPAPSPSAPSPSPTTNALPFPPPFFIYPLI